MFLLDVQSIQMVSLCLAIVQIGKLHLNAAKRGQTCLNQIVTGQETWDTDRGSINHHHWATRQMCISSTLFSSLNYLTTSCCTFLVSFDSHF